ncbi:uncharacterized protein LOC141678243 isoform X1 [Apium graveolens]|uniref:uncharacterized protein LOC141678243 isoform X1 n=1 Tax=Apium graveolens TaxID=4045 RepID=UPI003D7AAF77
MFFTKHTKINRDATKGIEIEKYAFDLIHIDELEKMSEDNRFLVDVAGNVENLEPLYTTQKTEHEKKMLKFDLSNGRFSVKVTLFDEIAERYEYLLKNKNEEPVMIIIATAKISKYQGLAYLTNYPATKIYVNPSHYSSKQITVGPEPINERQYSPEVEEEETMMTVKDIKAVGEDFLEKKIWCKITVKKLDEKAP